MQPSSDSETSPLTPPTALYWRKKLQAAAMHLGICMLVALIVYLLMNHVWYPNGLLTLAGGLKFFLVLVVCDVVLGPVITLIVYSIKKPKRERIMDLTVIALIQLAALLYGLHAIVMARPAFVVFTGYKISAINATNVEADELKLAKFPQFSYVSWQGPVPAIALMPKDKTQQQLVTSHAIEGKGLEYMVRFYEPINGAHFQILQTALKPIDQLKSIAPERKQDIDQALTNSQLDATTAGWLDVETSAGYGVVIVDQRTGALTQFLDIDA